MEGCEIDYNIQEMILSQALQRCLLRLGYSIPNRSHSFFCQWKAFNQTIISIVDNVKKVYSYNFKVHKANARAEETVLSGFFYG